MKVVTAEEMREIDRLSIEEFGLPGLVLMERAGLSVARRIMELYPSKRYVVLCGPGNNGGDGLVIARELHNLGHKAIAILMAQKKDLGPDCLHQYRLASKMGVRVEFRTSLTSPDLHGSVVVDALFGTGLKRPVTGRLAALFQQLNGSEAPVVSVDIPSGISADTGEVLGEAVQAAVTVTFGLPKRGHLLHPGAAHTGRLYIEDIGFPAGLLQDRRIKAELVDRPFAAALVPERPACSHKGDFGHVLVVAGSQGKTGAAMLTAKAALKAGAGLVTLAVPESLMTVFQCKVLEEMVVPLPDDGKGGLSAKALDGLLEFAASRADVIAVGPGLGVSPDTERLMAGLIKGSPAPLVIDADGLNSISDTKLLLKARSPLVLTPHPGEFKKLQRQGQGSWGMGQETQRQGQGSWVMGQETQRQGQGSRVMGQETQRQGHGSRVMGQETQRQGQGSWVMGQETQRQGQGKNRQETEGDRISAALSFSQATGTYLLLKGAPTVTATPEGEVYINSTGNPGMATAGSGDVLTGIVAALAGQGLAPGLSAALGAYLHGLSGDLAAAHRGMRSLTASAINRAVAESFSKLLDKTVF